MKDFFDVLQEKKLISAGSIIEKKVLEEVFEMEATHKDFIWRKFALKERVKADGFFVTEKDCEEGSFRILRTEEMADHGEAKLNKNQNSNLKIALILKAHDISSLNEEQKKRHNSVQSKAARCSAAMQAELLQCEVL